MNNIFTFYKKDNKSPIIIVAQTYLEAVSVLYELDNYANINYDLFVYKKERIDPMPYLNIDEVYWGIPYIMNEQQYNKVMNIVKSNKDKNDNEKYYNCGVVMKNDYNNDMLTILNKIHNHNNIKVLKDISDELHNILEKYLFKINNKKLRSDIYNDIYLLLKKYKIN